MQDPEHRVHAVPGAGAIDMNMTDEDLGKPAAANVGRMAAKRADIRDAVVDLGWTAPPVRLVDLNEQMGGLGGEFCYIYV